MKPFIDSPYATLEQLRHSIERLITVRGCCRDKDYTSAEYFSKAIKLLQEIEDDVVHDIPEWEKVMNEDIFPDGRPSIDEHLSNAYCDAIKR
tara:strand:- start:336 stop:611 length:276 start_codon:yes stop_codon:yes gene_type:complete